MGCSWGRGCLDILKLWCICMRMSWEGDTLTGTPCEATETVRQCEEAIRKIAPWLVKNLWFVNPLVPLEYPNLWLCSFQRCRTTSQAMPSWGRRRQFFASPSHEMNCWKLEESWGRSKLKTWSLGFTMVWIWLWLMPLFQQHGMPAPPS